MKSRILVALILSFVLLCSTVSRGSLRGRVIERNMSGPDVAEIQRMLQNLGYDVVPDGKFGAKTQAAVKTFQQDNGIVADGIVGPQTYKCLRDAGLNLVHRVQRGDTLIGLAKRYGSSVEAIMDANDLTSDRIYRGQKLVIPVDRDTSGAGGNGGDQVKDASSQGGETAAMMTYTVQRGESAYIIARKFNTTISAIARANNLRDPGFLREGQQLLIPSVGGGRVLESLRWPVKGSISSGYGWRTHPVYKNRQFHGGIDIAVPTGTIVRAAASGTVIQAENMGGFGLGVVIDHGGGVTTWYGHNSRLLVKKGDKVVRGQAIANSGNTGVSTGPHLDFRIKINGNTVNPLLWLP